MSKGIEDLGNGLGYIYITHPESGAILDAYENSAEGARKVKLDGVMASSVGGSRVATAIVTIIAPTGNGQVEKVDIDGIDAMDVATPIVYTVATTAEVLAASIVSAINTYSTGTASQNFTAIRIVDKVYIFTDSAAGTTYNGVTPILQNTGNFTYTVTQDFLGGSSTLQNYDESIGYNFWLDADYGSTQCSGGGVAVITSKANAVDITNYIVNVGLQGNIPQHSVSIRDGAITYSRKGSISILSLSGEGAADDILLSIVSGEVATGDIVILRSATNTITVTDATGNLSLQTSTYDVITGSGIMLIYNGADNTWYELNRSVQVIGSTANYRTANYGIFSLEGYNTAAVGAGGTVTYVANTDKKYQKLTGTAVLGAAQNYALDATAEVGDEFFLEYDAATTIGAFSLTIFGITLDANQALKGGLMFYARYLDAGWYTHCYPNNNEGNTYPFRVYTDLIDSLAVTVAKVEANLATETITRRVSFESGEECDNQITMYYPGSVVDIYFSVDKVIAGTDNGTITPKNNAGVAMTGGLITVTAASALDTVFGTAAAISANNTFVAGDVLNFTSAKTTKGGFGTLSIRVLKS